MGDVRAEAGSELPDATLVTMRSAWAGMLVGLGLAVGGLAIAAPPRARAVQPVEADGGRVVQALPLEAPVLRAKLPIAGQQLLARLDDEGASAEAAARRYAELLAQELSQAGVAVDPKTVDALASAIAADAGAAAMALAASIAIAIAELSYIERCEPSKECAADPAKQGVTAAGVKKMRERIAAEKTTARALLASQKDALARVTRKRARLEAAFPTLRTDAGAPR